MAENISKKVAKKLIEKWLKMAEIIIWGLTRKCLKKMSLNLKEERTGWCEEEDVWC